MKKGPVILVLIGVALLLALVFSPVTPAEEPVAETAAEEHSHEDHDHEHDAPEESAVDARIDEALRKMESGELPPMQAVMTIRDIADQHPENLKAQFTMGVMSLQTGQYEKAVERMNKVIEINQGHIEAYRLKGRAHLGLGDTTAATESYDRALSLADKETRSSIEQELVELKLTK